MRRLGDNAHQRRTMSPRKTTDGTDGLQPTFQPISALPVIATLIDGQLQDVEAQHATLLEARDKPHVLDDETLDRAIRLYTAMRDDVCLFDEQLNRWRKEQLTGAQRQEVERLTGCMQRLRKAIDDILVLVGELRKGTIDRILEMSDEEAGIAFLAGKLKLPGDR